MYRGPTEALNDMEALKTTQVIGDGCMRERRRTIGVGGNHGA